MTKSAPGPRCATIVGAYASGKTSLFEEMLFAAGAIDRRGTIKDGNTIGDGAAEARARTMSTELSVASFQYLGEPWTLIDAPGSVELTHEADCAMMVADVVVVVCEPMPDRAATVSRILKFLDDRAIPHLIFINKMDQAEASVRATLEALQAYSVRPLVLREIPMRDDAGRVTGMVDLVSERAWRWNPHKPSDLVSLPERLKEDEASARGTMLEALADFDDAIMEELLEDIVPSTDKIYETLSQDLSQDLVVPVFFGSAEQGNGIHRLLKALRHEAPGVEQAAGRIGSGKGTGTAAQVFKTFYAGQSGKLSLVRVWSGDLRDGMTLGKDRVGSLHSLFGRKTVAKDAAMAGEVVALGRMTNAATGDALATGPQAGPKAWPAVPPAMFALSIKAEKQSDEVKLAAAVSRLAEEDPSLIATHDAETGEFVLAGQGEVQLQIALSRMKSDLGLTTTCGAPMVPYRESITRPTSQRSRHKKQSGGHGEFADVQLDIQPRTRGAGFAFDVRIAGGVVPKQYFPAVEKGVRAFLDRGPLGFPLVDLAVTLSDGSFHTVDSSDMAFQKAAAKAMTEAMAACGSVLLEPYMNVVVSVPAEFTPKVQRLVTGRRGQLLGFDAKDGWLGWEEVVAQIPQAEIGDLIVELRSLSLGVGSFTTEFDHLREVAGKEAEKAVAARAAALKH